MTVKKYNPEEIAAKWDKIWSEKKIYSPDLRESSKPYYNLMMYPYPSAEGLHVGNVYAFSGADIYGRFQRMQGNDVFEPIGLDGFGIHSENFAIKIGRHPKEHARISEEHFYKQLSIIGNGFAWNNRLETYNPDYYKWTQWLFIQMFKSGLAYKGKAFVNWCPSCKTVLADEQVISGRCERCKTEVVRKEMSSWFFRITDYAERLLENIDGKDNEGSTPESKVIGPVTRDYDIKRYGLRWPEKIKIAQRNWIGKSTGALVKFPLGEDRFIEVFTTRIDTIFGVSFMVVAPEYAERLLDIIPEDKKSEVKNYINTALNKSEQERKKEEKEKTGVETGIFAVNPVSGEKIPVFVADYVLMEYGTGAVMGVPAHDARDFAFAKKYSLPILKVIKSGKEGDAVSADYGTLINSGEYNGLTSRDAMQKILGNLEKKGVAKAEINYHLRDWLISRQRYWGPPIPMIYCKECAAKGITYEGFTLKGQISEEEKADLAGWFPVPEKELPVVLPDIQDFKPKGDGSSPLDNAPDEWKKTACPHCGGVAERELDVSDTFLDSSWYFLRYPTVGLKDAGQVPFENEATEKWLPVDSYIGGAEHAVLHLLYSRYVTMVLHDLGMLSFEEPFPFLYGHGLLIKDGAKMSKSKGNVVNPDEYISKYGADALRTYLMFLGPFNQGGDFRDTGMEGMYRFVRRIWRLFTEYKNNNLKPEDEKDLLFKMHSTIKKVSEDMTAFKYNTAIASIMEYVNALEGKVNNSLKGETLKEGTWFTALKNLALLIAPFMPYLCEDVWVEVLNQKFSIHHQSWPKYNAEYTVQSEIVIPVQVNGKLRGQLVLASEDAGDQAKVEKVAREEGNVANWLKGKEIVKTIFVPGRLINFVIR